MINLLWSGVFMVLLLSGCGWDGKPTRNNDFIPLTSIEVVAVSPTIAAHTSTKLSVKGNFSGLYTRDITDQAVWSSDANAKVSSSRVTGLIPGTAILTATVGKISATYSLTVSSATVTAMTITPSALSIAKGLTRQFTVEGAFSDSTKQDLTFDAVWASDAPTVATISDAADSKGFVKTLAAGPATITASFDTASGSTLLTVTEPVLQSIALSPANPSLLTLTTGKFTATGTYSDGSTPDITSQAAWDSTNKTFATITATGGVATTLSQGTTSISASLSGITGTTNLKVTGGNLNANAIVISPLAPKLVIDTTGRMTATGTFSNGSTRDITGAVEWSVAGTTAETTKAGGNLVWLKALAVTSTTTISAKYGAVTATANLNVIAPPITSIELSATNLDLTVGTSSPLTVAAKYNDGTIQDVTNICTWTSNDETTATVGTSGHAAGRVTGVASGSTKISATYGGKTVPTPATVTVIKRVIQSLTITPSTVTIGNQVPFMATAIYSNGSVVVTEDAKWTIDTPNVAILADSVNQPGQIVGVDSGSATLTATFDGKSQTATIIVTGP